VWKNIQETHSLST